jgi:hypothetical protein
VPIWDNIGRELRNLWEILTTGEASPDDDTREESEEEIPEPGGFFGGDEPPDQPPGSSDFPEEEPVTGYDNADDGGYFTYRAGEGPYTEDWGEREIRFWDRQFDEHIFDNQSQYDQTLEVFYNAYMAGDDEITREDRKQAREDFTELTYILDIDWEAFKEYYSDM